jgi:hypothetical protein
VDEPLYTDRGGIWDGCGGGILGMPFSESWPFAVLKVYADRLELHGHVIPKTSITVLRREHGLISRGLYIESRALSGWLVFWTFDFESLRQELEKDGYPVSL